MVLGLYGATSKTLPPVFNGLTVCHCDAEPSGLCICHNSWLIKVKIFRLYFWMEEVALSDKLMLLQLQNFQFHNTDKLENSLHVSVITNI
jgi:hypothetical protein